MVPLLVGVVGGVAAWMQGKQAKCSIDFDSESRVGVMLKQNFLQVAVQTFVVVPPLAKPCFRSVRRRNSDVCRLRGLFTGFEIALDEEAVIGEVVEGAAIQAGGGTAEVDVEWPANLPSPGPVFSDFSALLLSGLLRLFFAV